MIKATTARLARLLSSRCSVVQESNSAQLFLLVQGRLGVKPTPDFGEAKRLAAKLLRLRETKSQKQLEE